MAIQLPPLPYALDALEPYVSSKTLKVHHEGHHKKYVETLNAMIEGTANAGKSLDELVRENAGKAPVKKLFNNAAQAWNHDFFWHCMTPEGGGAANGAIEDSIKTSFGSHDRFREAFVKAAGDQFGSGWAWLVAEDGKLKIMTTSNAEIPIGPGVVPLIACDVWEHAYYLDYQNKRERFVEAFIDHLVNWRFANERFARRQAVASGATAEKELFL